MDQKQYMEYCEARQSNFGTPYLKVIFELIYQYMVFCFIQISPHQSKFSVAMIQ